VLLHVVVPDGIPSDQ